MDKRTDEQLIKQAKNPGCGLIVLGGLASLVAAALVVGCVVVVINEKAVPQWVALGVVAATISSGLIAVGYWMLAVAANRWNPTALTIPIIILIGQFALGVVGGAVVVIMTAQSVASFQPQNYSALVIPVIIVALLASKRSTLMELRQRGLWNSVFGAAKPSIHLCIAGGILLALGFLALNASVLGMRWHIGGAQTKEYSHVQLFVETIKKEEKELMDAFKPLSGNYTPADVQNALGKATVLEQRMKELEKAASADTTLLPILENYCAAVGLWKNGLAALTSSPPDIQKAQSLLELGDKRRAEACTAFDERYTAKRK